MKAYVIMPYGNASPELKKEYDKIFRFLIRSAVETFDHSIEIVRQDHSGEGGQIIGNVIENLSSGELVIADLSAHNWNVAYELGIRHSLTKSGTILLCNDETPLPFDIQNMNVIIYSRSSWMDEIDEITDRIVQAIRNAITTRRCDSPVHLRYPALPESLTAMLNNNNDQEQQRIVELTTQNQKLQEQVNQLHQRLEDAGLDSNSSDSKTKGLLQVFTSAVKNRDLISDAAVDHLRELQEEKKYEEFARFLAQVLENGYLDETDCRNIYIICSRLGIPEISKRYIEIAVKFYPDNEELQGLLANEYSKDYREKDRAQTIVNDMLGVRRVNGVFELIHKVRSERMLSSFFDVYLHLKKYTEMIQIGKLLLKSTPALAPRILRNIADAAIRLQEFDLAYSALCRALRTDPTNPYTHYQLYRYYHSKDDEAKAYSAIENAICCENSDTSYYYLMAGHICDELQARTEDGTIKKIDVRMKERYVFPFILQALTIDKNTYEKAINFLKKNRITNMIPKIISYLKQEISYDDAFGGINMEFVNYCYNKSDIITAEIEAMPDDFDKYL